MKLINTKKTMVIGVVAATILTAGVSAVVFAEQSESQNTGGNTSTNTNNVSQDQDQSQNGNQHQVQTNNQTTDVNVNNDNENENNINIKMSGKPEEKKQVRREFVPTITPETGAPVALFAGSLVSLPLGLLLRKYRG